MSDQIERLADYLYAEYTGYDLDARRTSTYAERWIGFAKRALEYAGINITDDHYIDPFWTSEHPCTE